MGRQPFLVSTIYLPRRYRERYDMEFLKRWAIALTVVGLELARPEVRRLSCIAEKLALHTVIRMATDRAIELGERPPELAPLWEDLAGHEVLTLLQPGAVPPGLEFDRWFTGAGEHPFYRSRATGSA
jgi:hypothetical protein